MNYVTAADLYVEAGGLRIARALHDFVNAEAIPGTGIEPRAFWQGFGMLVRELAPRNHALLDRRDALQEQIDDWHRPSGGQPGACRSTRRPTLRSCARSAICSRSRREFADRHQPRRCRRSPASPGRNSSCR